MSSELLNCYLSLWFYNIFCPQRSNSILWIRIVYLVKLGGLELWIESLQFLWRSLFLAIHLVIWIVLLKKWGQWFCIHVAKLVCNFSVAKGSHFLAGHVLACKFKVLFFNMLCFAVITEFLITDFNGWSIFKFRPLLPTICSWVDYDQLLLKQWALVITDNL